MAEDWFPGPGDWTVIRGKNGTWRVQYKGEDVSGCVGIDLRPGNEIRLEFVAYEYTIRDADPKRD
jgi:hypothetical protein